MTRVIIYIIIMIVVTYLCKALPITLIRRQIKSRFIRSFLYYVPYVTLAVMTVPAIINATQSPIAGAIALVVGIILAWITGNLFIVASACAVAVFVAELILPVTQSFGLSETIGHTISFALAFTIITAMHIILGELTPKSLAISQTENILLTIALPMLIFWKVMYPFVIALNVTARFVSKHLGLESSGEGEVAHNPEEIRLLMEESHKQGLVDDTEVDFVDNVFDFTELSVREIMVPRTDMVCLYTNKSYEENLQIMLDEQMTRYPICNEDKDHIIGFLHVKDLITWRLKGNKQFKPNLTKLARKVFVVPESMDVSVLLKMMQKNRSQLAIVVDEYGGTSGMVTIEDIVEELVGDIQDEFDEERPEAEKRAEKVYSIDAKMSLEDLEDEFDIAINDEDVDTVGGWLTDRIGGEPRVGQTASYNGNTFYVEEVDGVRITRILLRLA